MTADEALSSLSVAQRDIARASDILSQLCACLGDQTHSMNITESFGTIVGLIEGRDEAVIDAWNVLDPEGDLTVETV